MFNTAGEAFVNARECPASHPVRMAQVAYETLWDTTGTLPQAGRTGDELPRRY